MLLAFTTAAIFSAALKSSGVFFLFILSPFLIWPDDPRTTLSLLVFSLLFLFFRNVSHTAIKSTLLLLLISVVYISSKPPYPHLRVDWPQYMGYTNQLRGEHTITHTPLGRLLHNKLTLVPSFLNHSLSALNPSFIFGLGDRNPESKSPWVSPLPFTFAFLVLAGSWRRFFGWTLTAWLLAAANYHHLYESTLTFFFTFLVLGAGLKFDQLSPRLKVLFLSLTLTYLGFSIYFLANYGV